MKLPEPLLNSLAPIDGFDRASFTAVHDVPVPLTSIRLNPGKNAPLKEKHDPIRFQPVPWSQYGYYLTERPSFTFDPYFHAGCYYVQEASSMFLEQALKQTVDLSKPLNVLDLCAAPGGKSTHIQSLISKQSQLVSNEVIRSRAGILKSNVIKWGCENVRVTCNDPRDFTGLENYFDVIVADAPCSGSGLFRRDPEAVSEWSEKNVDLCSGRQLRILSDIWPSLKTGGVLIYSTCSYSKKENEDIADWVVGQFSAEPLPLKLDPDWGIEESSIGYRFWPYRVKGEGFYLACFQKTEGANGTVIHKKKPLQEVPDTTKQILKKWIDPEGLFFFKNDKNILFAWPESLVTSHSHVAHSLRELYSGIQLGELIRDKFIPAHALAMSTKISGSVNRIELDELNSIKYLQRKTPDIISEKKGWQLACYKGQALGWVNSVPGRVNNYYPVELRIIKDN